MVIINEEFLIIVKSYEISDICNENDLFLFFLFLILVKNVVKVIGEIDDVKKFDRVRNNFGKKFE